MFYYRRAVVPFCRVVGPVRVCLPYSRLLTGIPILLAEFQNLRWNSNKNISKHKDLFGILRPVALCIVYPLTFKFDFFTRWAQHHEDGIQQSYFNGAGFESWENVWGIWNGITQRDGEAIR